MCPSDRRNRTSRSGGFKPGILLGTTTLAVVMAAVIAVLGWISAHPGEVIASPPTTVPHVNTFVPLETTVSASTVTAFPAKTLPAVNVVTSQGSLTAPVTVIEYSDFQCAHCQQFALTIEKELEYAYVATGKVRVIYRFINVYPESQKANEAAACAAEQGQFWPYYYQLMQQRASPNLADLPVEKLQSLAQQIGLNISLFNNSLLSGKFAAKVMSDDAEGRALGVTGTPTFFINGIKKDGAKDLQDLSTIIDPIIEKQEK